MPSVRERNATPLPFRSSKMRTRCESERPRRSSFQTPAHHLRAIRRGGSSGRGGCRAHVDALGPALAAPDLSPKLLGLAVGHPSRGAMAFLDRLKPKDERIYARVGFAVWVRDVLGASDHLKGFGQSARIERRIVA